MLNPNLNVGITLQKRNGDIGEAIHKFTFGNPDLNEKHLREVYAAVLLMKLQVVQELEKISRKVVA